MQDYKTRIDEIRRVFSKLGEIKDVYLPRDYYTHKPRGFGFVEFTNEKDAKRALEEMHGSELNGSII